MKRFSILMLILTFIAGLNAQNIASQVDDYGILNGPNNTQWVYASKYTKTGSFIDSVNISIFNEKYELVGQIAKTIKIEGTTGVNHLEVNAQVTKNFFNTDDNYEVSLFMHAVTPDYVGRYINMAFSLGETTQYVCSVDGRPMFSENMSDNTNSDLYSLVCQNSVMEKGKTYLVYNVYTKANADSENAPILAHSFKLNMENIMATGYEPAPILMFNNNHNVNYVTWQYEKAFFAYTPSGEEKLNEGNYFIITHYNDKFEVVSETKLPITKTGEYKYIIPTIGGLDNQNDVIVKDNGTVNYLVKLNKHTSFDAYQTSFVIYNTDGSVATTLTENTKESYRVSNIDGYERQWMFKLEDKYTFVNIPSGNVVAQIPTTYDNNELSTVFDRYATDNGYQYAFAIAETETDNEGNTTQKIAWFNNDATFSHYDVVNLGTNIETASIYITNPLLNPNLFDTDDTREYIVSVYRKNTTSNTKENAVLICNTKNETLLDISSDATKGGNLSAYYPLNCKTKNASLLCIYTNKSSQYSLDFVSLPVRETITEPEKPTDTPIIFENSTHINFNFDGETITTQGNIRIYNINGLLISENENSINTSMLNSGLYIITITNNSEFYSTKILIK